MNLNSYLTEAVSHGRQSSKSAVTPKIFNKSWDLTRFLDEIGYKDITGKYKGLSNLEIRKKIIDKHSDEDVYYRYFETGSTTHIIVHKAMYKTHREYVIVFTSVDGWLVKDKGYTFEWGDGSTIRSGMSFEEAIEDI